MGKHKYFKVKGFLNFWHEAEIHAVSKIWEKWIAMVQEKYGKIQIFQIYGSLKYFGWSRNPYNSQNMGKVNSHNTGKVWEKANILTLWVSQIFWVKHKSIQFPKHGKSESHNTGESMEKKQTFQSYGFLKYFGWSRNPYNSQNMGKVNPIIRGKVWKKNKHSKVMGFSNILGEAEIHTIPKTWEKWIP